MLPTTNYQLPTTNYQLPTIRIAFFFLVIFLSFRVQAQDPFYYSKDTNKTYLTEVDDYLMIHFLEPIETVDEGFNQFLGSYYTFSDLELLNELDIDYTLIKAYTVLNSLDTLFESDEIVLRFKPNTTILQKQGLESLYDLTLITETSAYTRYQSSNPLADAAAIYESGFVEYSHPNFFFRPKAAYIPNDSYFNKQFYLHNTGQVINDNQSGTVDADIDAPEAWDITKGDSNIIVAVIDFGIESNHPDLPNTRQVRLPGANLSGVFTGIGANDLSPQTFHGTQCAGIVAAEQDNNMGISGVAPKSKIMPVKFESGATASILADCISFAADSGASIISGSFSIINPIPVLENALQIAGKKNLIQVYATGNTRGFSTGPIIGGGTPNPDGTVDYPARYNLFSSIAVGASNLNNQIASYSPISEFVEIVAPSGDSSGNEVFPPFGRNVWTIDETSGGINPSVFPLPISGTDFLAFTGRFGGTSAATPMVAGIAALVLAINPCLGNVQVKDILLNTADKVGGYNYNWSSQKPGHSKELGYGKVNAFQAVLAAQQMQSSSLDLMVKDVPRDYGLEPDTIAKYLYISEDIWVRNQQNGLEKQFHEDPEFDPIDPVYVYVRVKNKSCVDASMDDTLKLYWSKAGTSLSWPNHWDGSVTTPALMGEPIGELVIGELKAGKDTILEFAWNPPDPTNYSAISTQPWHFCLLARVESTNDPMTYTEGTVLWQNVKNNNNIAWKNIDVVNKSSITETQPQLGLGGVIAIGNDEFVNDKTIDLTFEEALSTINFGNPLFDDAEIKVILDETATIKWEDGGELSTDFDYLGNGEFLVVGANAELRNLYFEAGERATLYLGVNFLTEEVGEKVTYHFHVEQYESGGGEFIGGEQYLVHRDDRDLFYAQAGSSQSINMGESLTLQATDIGEPAIYNWYDENDSLIFSGKDTTFIPTKNSIYTLEVIAYSDGFKDYDRKGVEVKEFFIRSIYPNPSAVSQSRLTVNYEASKAVNAYFRISNTSQTITSTYIISPSQNQTSINIGRLLPGNYTLSLICDGIVKDTKIITKN